MKIRPVKKGHITFCIWCKENHTQNVCLYHLTGANRQSCLDHLPMLEEIKRKAEELDRQEYGEADYQTWLKV